MGNYSAMKTKILTRNDEREDELILTPLSALPEYQMKVGNIEVL